MISLICGIKKNKLVNIKINRLTDIENKLVVTCGEKWEGQHRGRGLRCTNY